MPRRDENLPCSFCNARAMRDSTTCDHPDCREARSLTLAMWADQEKGARWEDCYRRLELVKRRIDLRCKQERASRR